MPTAASDLSLLVDPTRVRVVRLLAERSLNVSQLADLLELRQPTVSQHMQRLQSAGIVRRIRQGREVRYELRPTAVGDAIGNFAKMFTTPMSELPFMAKQIARWPNVVGAPIDVTVGAPQGAVDEPADLRSVLFVCVGNSARSQIAEGFARALGGPGLCVMSAGLEPLGVNQLARDVMAEVGIDLSGQTSKAIKPYHIERADLVITLCGAEGGWRPAVDRPYAWRYWPVPDPAQGEGSTEQRLARFRSAREQVRAHIEDLLTEFSILH